MIDTDNISGIFIIMLTGISNVFLGMDGVKLTVNMTLLDLYIYVMVVEIIIDFIIGFTEAK